MTSTLKQDGRVGVRQKSDVIGRSGTGGQQVFWTSNVFFITENWICAITRHHTEPNINMLLTRNLLFDSDVRQ